MTTEFREGQQPHRVIREQISTRAIEALMSNYRDPQQAFLELIDNAVDNRIDGRPLLIRIRVSANELSVANQGGRGLDLDGLEKFFVWGYSEKTTGQIGFFGVGGKAAMGYLGRSMEVVCSAQSSNVQYKIFDPSWETRPEGELKQFDWEEKRATTDQGYFRAKITNLKRQVDANALRVKLSDIYRPLLMDGSAEIFVNNTKVEPLRIDYVTDDPNLKPENMKVQTRLMDWIILTVGVLQEGQRIKPGIRCYYNGRLIEDEQFFGHPTPTQLPQMSRLIGEAYLDSVPVTTNKNSFDKGSVKYEAATNRLRLVLTPWIEKIAKLKIEQKSPIEAYERDLAKRAKRVLEHVFATTGLVVKSMLPEGESQGRRPPTRSGSPPIQPTGRPGGPGPKEGQTAPTLDATIGEIKRWGATFAWEVTAMGSSGKRSDIILENGRNVLKINSDFPWYQAAKNAGDEALGLYILETGIWQICNTVTKDKAKEEAEALYDRALRESGSLAQSEFRIKKGARRGTINFKASR